MNKNISNTPHNLIWVDLEMTGLNPDVDHILEIAIVITDQNLNILASDFNLIIHQPKDTLDKMSADVKIIHTKNDLINLVPKSDIDLYHAEQQALKFIAPYVAKQTSPICGNSICMDRRFLFKHMPQLESYFHYRNLDVSTIKNLGIYWFSEKIKHFTKTTDKHRAQEDILQSIEELKFYREHLFIKL